MGNWKFGNLLSTVLACAAAILLSLSANGQPIDYETVIMKVILNTEDLGDYIFLLTPDGDALFPAQDLLEWGIVELPQGVRLEDVEHISLQSLSPELRFEIDRNKATLHVTAYSTLFEKQTVDLAYSPRNDVVHTKNMAGFFNYGIRLGTGANVAVTVPSELGISFNRMLGFSSFSYTNSGTEQSFVRLLTNITKDYPEQHARLIFGDFSAFSGELGSGGSFGGVSFSSNFSATPYFIKGPGLNLSGLLETPSDVEIYLNDQLIRTEHFGPGEFELRNLRNATGSGEVTMVVRDAFGREETIFVPYYLSSTLLKPGLHEYSYNFGFRREGIGQKSFDYSDPAFLAFHRYGVSSILTAGFHVEVDANTLNLGPEATFLIGRWGEVNTSIALTRSSGATGYGSSFSYFYTGKGWNIRASARGFSEDYARLSTGTIQENIKAEGLISGGLSGRRFGSISMTLSAAQTHGGRRRTTTLFSYNRSLGRNISLLLRGSRTKEARISHEFFAGVNIFLGRNRSASLNFRKQENRIAAVASIQQNPPRGPGFGYRMSAAWGQGTQNEDEIDGLASVQYRGTYGVYSLEYRKTGGLNSYDLNLSGSLAYIDRSLFLTRPITDSFAVVKVGNLQGVKVYSGNQLMGRTNSNGEALVPEFISYIDNNLSIDDQDIPTNYSLTTTQKYVAPPLRGGSILDFDVTRFQGFEGFLFLVNQGERKPAEYAALQIQINDAVMEAVVGKKGFFYLENIPPGIFPAIVSLDENTCHFELVIPDSADVAVDLGELECTVYTALGDKDKLSSGSRVPLRNRYSESPDLRRLQIGAQYSTKCSGNLYVVRSESFS